MISAMNGWIVRMRMLESIAVHVMYIKLKLHLA